MPLLTDCSQAGNFGKHQLLLEAFQEHLRAHHFEGQTAVWVCGARLNSQLHHKVPPCQLSKDMQVPGVPAGARWHFQTKCSREAVSDPQKSPIQVPKNFSNHDPQPVPACPLVDHPLPCRIDSGLLVRARTCSSTPPSRQGLSKQVHWKY